MRILDKKNAEEIFHEATAAKKISKKANYFYIKESLDYRLDLLTNSFPENTLHAISVKTNNHHEVLKHIASRGFGFEAASIEEVKLCLSVGACPQKIVFDSPVKTREEIKYCHENLPGALINVNCLEEVERYPENFSGKLGLRINPLVSLDIHEHLNVSLLNSKFGVPITQKEAILKVLTQTDRFTAIHFHIGSGNSQFQMNLEALKLALNLMKTANDIRQKAGMKTLIDTIDIGGGINFDIDHLPKSIEYFVNELKKMIRNEKVNLVTEFGNFIHEYNSFVSSSVEYITKNLPKVHNAFVHIGADLFLRKVYSNMNINYPISVMGKEGFDQTYRIVGPLCFAGDVLYESVNLPQLEQGDEIFIYNSGANSYSMWSMHCSREKINFVFV